MSDKTIDDQIFAIEDYVGGNIEGISRVDRMEFTVFLRRTLNEVDAEARIDELENATDKVDWRDSDATISIKALKTYQRVQNRLAQLKENK